MNSTWLMAPSSRLREAIRCPARAADFAPPRHVERIDGRCQRFGRLPHLELDRLRELLARERGGALRETRLGQRRAIGAAVEQLPRQHQRCREVVVAGARAELFALRAGVHAERQRRLELRLRERHLRAGRGFQRVEARQLGAGARGLDGERTRVGRGRRRVVRQSSILERRVERAIQQEIHVALRLRDRVLGLALLLLDREQLGASAQHLILGDATVAEQRVGDAQVLRQHLARGCHDQSRAPGLQVLQVREAHVVMQLLREHQASILRAAQQLALRPQRGGNRRLVQRLSQREMRVLLAIAQERDRRIAEQTEARRLALRDEQLVERLIGGIQQLAGGEFQLPPALVA